MRKMLIFIVFLAMAGQLSGKEVLDSLFQQANEAYSAGDFEQAYNNYMQIQELGYESEELYYNMGNAAFRSNKLGYAILYYKKALKLDPSNEEAKKNLNYVSIYKEDQLDAVPEFFLKSWLHALFRLFTLTAWSFIALLFFIVTLIGTLLYIFARSLAFKKSGFFLALTSLFIFVLSLSAGLNRNEEIKNPESAIIIAPSVVVKSSPSLSGTDLFVLHEGTMVKVDEEVGSWKEIKISDGRVGWITTQDLASI